MVASKYRTVVRITTQDPSTEGLIVKVVAREDNEQVLLSGVTDSGGVWSTEADLDSNTLITLFVLDEENVTGLVKEGKPLIYCNVPLHALNPMDCYLKQPKKLSHDEMHKKFRDKEREMKLSGVANPDPDTVARHAFKY